MTTPAPTPQPQPQTRTVYTGPWRLPRWLLVAGTVLFIIGAFAAAGHELANIPDWSWFGGAFAAWVLSGAVT